MNIPTTRRMSHRHPNPQYLTPKTQGAKEQPVPMALDLTSTEDRIRAFFEPRDPATNVGE